MDPLQNVLTTLQLIAQGVDSLTQAIRAVFPQSVATTTSATAGAASALPATPAGYLTITLPNGQPAKVPFYNV